MPDTSHGLGSRLAQARCQLRGARAARASDRAASREDRRAARAARTSLKHDLAAYTSPADLDDLDAMLDRYSDEDTAEIRRILAARRASLLSH